MPRSSPFLGFRGELPLHVELEIDNVSIPFHFVVLLLLSNQLRRAWPV